MRYDSLMFGQGIDFVQMLYVSWLFLPLSAFNSLLRFAFSFNLSRLVSLSFRTKNP